MYVFDDLPIIYKEVCKKLESIEQESMRKVNLPYLARLRRCTQYKCDECDSVTTKQALLNTHILKSTTRIDGEFNLYQPKQFLKNHQ